MLSRKLSQYSSHDKMSECRDWRGEWGRKVQKYSENLTNSNFLFILEFPKNGFDYRALAEKELVKSVKTRAHLKLVLKKI